MLPGAAVSAVGWHLYSGLFSLYLRCSHGLENMYGSLAALIGIMLWLYGCMYLVLAGLEVNVWFIGWHENHIKKKNRHKKLK
jgi:membrane protein